MNVDGSDLRVVAGQPGAEFDGAWSPDGEFIAYRDSRRGINEDDEIYGRRQWIRGTEPDPGPRQRLGPRLVAGRALDRLQLGPRRDPTARLPRGSDDRRRASDRTDAWFEYPSFSPDGTHLVFMGHAGSDYDIYVVELETAKTTQLTDAPGSDGWPVWSPDGSSIAFASERDDCARTEPGADCWRSGEPGEHHDIWLMDVDGANQRRVTPEVGQFVAWSPDGQYLLVSGHTLFVVRPDGTGRL